MTRGHPAYWSAAFGTPFLAVGVYVYAFQSAVQVLPDQPEASPTAGLVLALFGLFVIGLGLYVEYVAAPDSLTMREGESVLDTRTPALRHTLGQALVGVVPLLVGCYLLFFDDGPLLYPTAALAVGLYVLSTGLYRYWRNTLTRYVVTNRRVIEEYWFLSVVRNEVPFGKVRGVEERRSAWEALFGVGSVAVRSGADGSLTVAVDDVYRPGELAELIREQLDADGGYDPTAATAGPEGSGSDRGSEAGDDVADRGDGDDDGTDPDGGGAVVASSSDGTDR